MNGNAEYNYLAAFYYKWRVRRVVCEIKIRTPFLNSTTISIPNMYSTTYVSTVLSADVAYANRDLLA